MIALFLFGFIAFAAVNAMAVVSVADHLSRTATAAAPHGGVVLTGTKIAV